MPFQTVPAIGTRYWAGIALASISGANLGDFVVDGLGWSFATGLPALALAFAAISAGERWSGWRTEAWYWLGILAVRAAATELADLVQGRRGFALGHLWTPLLFAALLLALLPLRRTEAAPGGKPRADGLYWLTMLTAGTLGTALADAMARAVEPKTVSALIALAVGSAAVVIILRWRAQLFGAGPAAGYWAAIVALRTWGTTMGDMLAFVLTLPVSLVLSLAAMAGVLGMWARWHRSAARRDPANI